MNNASNTAIAGTCGLLALSCAANPKTPEKKQEKPNIIFIMADDLGYRELGCYGQKKILTPNIDKMAAEGQKWSQFYSGSAVCAPARCTLLTGMHGGHAYVRDNKEVPSKQKLEIDGFPPIHIYGGQAPIPKDAIKLVKALKAKGYVTGCFGKWGLGAPGSTSDPMNSGFDRFYGYNCQRHAHHLYPEYLVDNDKNQPLKGNLNGKQTQYAPQLIADQLIEFLQQHGKEQFFIYYPTVLPHLPLRAPKKYVDMYKGKWPDPPAKIKTYGGSDAPKTTYAAMITFLDDQVGRIMAKLKDLGIDKNTIVFFTSDNGTTYIKKLVDYKFFNSVGKLKGLKGSLYEGGIREPLIVRWPTRVTPGTTTDLPAALYDIPATIAAIADMSDAIGKTDGVSLLPTILGKPEKQEKHKFLFWDFAGYGGQIAVRMGKWKGIIRTVKKNPNAKLQLYDLESDPGEKNNLAEKHPEVVKQIMDIIAKERTKPIEPKFRFGTYER